MRINNKKFEVKTENDLINALLTFDKKVPKILICNKEEFYIYIHLCKKEIDKDIILNMTEEEVSLANQSFRTLKNKHFSKLYFNDFGFLAGKWDIFNDKLGYKIKKGKVVFIEK